MPEILPFDKQYPKEARAFKAARRNVSTRRVAILAVEIRTREAIKPKEFAEALEDSHQLTSGLVATAQNNGLFKNELFVPEINQFSNNLKTLKNAYIGSTKPKCCFH